MKFAHNFASRLKGGDIVALSGNLGTGKTQFVKGVANFFKIKKNITSPTFVLIKVYHVKKNHLKPSKGSQFKLVHIDCYRLSSPRELLDIGLQELLDSPRNIILIEWAEKIKNILPKKTFWIKFSYGKKINERLIKLK